MNVEYLKQCVFKFMASAENSERKRLCPVIATVLNFTAKERAIVEEAVSKFAGADNVGLDRTFADIGSWLGFKPT